MQSDHHPSAGNGPAEIRPLTIDRATLREQVRGLARSNCENLNLIHGAVILVLTFLSVKALLAAVSGQNTTMHVVSFSITFVAGGYQVWKWWRQRRRDSIFDDTLPGIIRQTLSRIDAIVALTKSLSWSFVLPLFALAGLGYGRHGAEKTLIAMVALAALLVIGVCASRREFQSDKQSLRALLDQLPDADKTARTA
jgi:hypothetical protein